MFLSAPHDLLHHQSPLPLPLESVSSIPHCPCNFPTITYPTLEMFPPGKGQSLPDWIFSCCSPAFAAQKALEQDLKHPSTAKTPHFIIYFSFIFSFLIKVFQQEVSKAEGTAQPDLLSHRPALLIPLRFRKPLTAFEAKHTIWAQRPDSPFPTE